MFSNRRNAILYDGRGVRRDTKIECWNPRWDQIQSRCPGYVDSVGFLDMLLVRLEENTNYVLRFVVLLDHADELKRLMRLDAC